MHGFPSTLFSIQNNIVFLEQTVFNVLFMYKTLIQTFQTDWVESSTQSNLVIQKSCSADYPVFCHSPLVTGFKVGALLFLIFLLDFFGFFCLFVVAPFMFFDLLKIARNNSWRACWPPGPPRIHIVHPNGVLRHLMRNFPAELQSWNQFPAFAEVPIYQCCVHLSHSQLPCEVSIGTELSCPCPLDWNRIVSYIVVVIYLMAVAELQSKWMSILHLPDKGLTILSLVLPPRIRSV